MSEYNSEYYSSYLLLKSVPGNSNWETCFGRIERLTIILSFIALLGVLAFVSNIVFLFVVYKQPLIRKTPLAVYLIVLSCLDVFISIGYTSFVGSLLSSLSSFSGQFVASSLNALYILMIFRFPLPLVSAVLMICIAWERYKAVCKPIQTITSPTNLTRHLIVTVTWTILLMAVFFFLPLLIAIPVSRRANANKSDGSEVYVAFFLVTGVIDLISVITTVSLYYNIMKTLRRAPGLGQRSDNRYFQEQRNLTRMVLINTSVFFILVILQDVTLVLVFSLVCDNDTLHCCDVIMVVIQAMCLLMNSGLNPIIYNVFGSLYRTAFFKTFPCLQCSSPAPISPDDASIQLERAEGVVGSPSTAL